MALRKPAQFNTALGTYHTIDVMGEGGSGRVFLVKNSKGDRFAIKCLFPELVTSGRLSRFRNELRFLQRTTHPNILPVLDTGLIAIEVTSTPFFVMPYFPLTLRKIIDSGTSNEQYLEYFSKILDGLEVAHRKEIWHRDLKPENILVDPSNFSLVIADFGIAHFSAEELYTVVETQRSDRMANFQYAAPEKRRRGHIVDQRADIYALGLILNEMYTKEIPIGTEYKPISELAPGFSYLDIVVDRMIRQSPGQRPSSTNEVRLEISSARQAQYAPVAESKQSNEPATRPHPILQYRAEVDCVGRIDDYENRTVLSISAGLSYSIMIPAIEKQKALVHTKDIHPNWGRTRIHVYLYSVLLFLLIRGHIKKLDSVVIDIEYSGYEPEIKGLLLQLLRWQGISVSKDRVLLKRLDRTSAARQMASRVYKGVADPDLILTAKQVAEVAK